MADLRTLQANVFPGESGGDYDALFGFSNRPGGAFAGVRPTQMTINEVLALTDPRGPYAQWVKSQIGRVATPVGGYQVVGSTLRDVVRRMGLRGDERFDKDMQDRIGMEIYRTQGPGAWEGWGKGGNGGRVTMSSKGGPAMGLLDMQDEPQTFGDRLREGWRSGSLMDNLALAFNSMRMNPDQNLAQIVQNRQEQRQLSKSRNATAEWLMSQNRPELAAGVMSGAVPAATALTMHQQDLTAARNAAADPNVQTSAMLPDQSGTVMTMRDGSLRVMTVGGETLTGQAAADFVRQAQERNVEYQQDVYKARRLGTGLGETAAADLSAAPSTISTADTTLSYIDAIRQHPGLEQGTGFSSVFNAVPGTPGYDFQNRVKQVASGAFMTAIQDLRGMGALSNAEGETATKAVTRMDTATSKEEFLSALSDYENIVRKGKERAQTVLQNQPGAPAPTPAPTPTPTPTVRTYNPQTNTLE